jgi:recombination protein RecA
MSAQVLPFKLPAFEAVPLAEQLPAGRLTEIVRLGSGAQLSLAVSCVFAAQARGEPVAWLQLEGGSLFPPDLADNGVDLDALLIVHVPIGSEAGGGPAGLCKAAELLLRSGGFGLVVIDMVTGSGLRPGVASELRLQAQSRLLGLAREHDSAVLLLSEGAQQRASQRTAQHTSSSMPQAAQDAAHASPHTSLGPLVALCIEPHRERIGRGAFRIEPRARKDKSGSLCTLALESRRGPWGLL